MKNAIIVYNPLAGSQNFSSKLDIIIKQFQLHNIMLHPYRYLIGDMEVELVDIVKQNIYDFILVSGGDGTLNSVINIIVKNNIELPIGIIPAGTCNDFARCLGISENLNETIHVILENNIMEVDIGLVGRERYFLSTCAGGLFVNVSFDTHSELKKNFGSFAYYLKALSEVANIKSFYLKILTEDEIIEEDAILFLIVNGKHAAGFSNIIQNADITDGKMDIIIIKNCSPIDLASLFFKFISGGTLKDKNVIEIKTNKCLIESNSEILLSIDGEKGMHLPQNIEFLNKRLKVFYNKQFLEK